MTMSSVSVNFERIKFKGKLHQTRCEFNRELAYVLEKLCEGMFCAAEACELFAAKVFPFISSYLKPCV